MANSKAYTCRLNDEDSELIEAGARESGLNRADILRRAFDRYVVENPDKIDAFGRSGVKGMSDPNQGPQQHRQQRDSMSTVYDPTTDLTQ